MTVLSSQVSGDQDPTPTGQQTLVVDRSLLTLSGLTEVKAQGSRAELAGAVWAVVCCCVHTDVLSPPQQAFAGQVKNDLLLEDAKR